MNTYVVGNLKMHLETCRLRDEYVDRMHELSQSLTSQQLSALVICPPHVHLEKFITKLPGLTIGAQDAHHELRGAHTGSTSSNALKSLGVECVIIGHSERRVAGESLDTVCKKVQTALLSGLQVIVCVGFLSEGQDEVSVLKSDVAAILESVTEVVPVQKQGNLVFAYEPVWAIGTGKTPTTHHIQTIVLVIRKEIMRVLDDGSVSLPVLYGGSVTTENAQQIVEESTADGVLVGGASLDPANLVQMVKMLNK